MQHAHTTAYADVDTPEGTRPAPHCTTCSTHEQRYVWPCRRTDALAHAFAKIADPPTLAAEVQARQRKHGARRSIAIGPNHARAARWAQEAGLTRHDAYSARHHYGVMGTGANTIVYMLDPWDWPNEARDTRTWLRILLSRGVTIMDVNTRTGETTAW